MKNVVILSAFLRPFRSGAEACAEEVAVRLQGEYNVTIVTARMRRTLPQNDLLQEKVRVVRVGMGNRFDPWLYPFLAPLAVRRLQPDLVHAILETFAGAALAACRVLLPGIPRLLTLQTTNRSFLKKRIMRSADRVTAISSVLVLRAQAAGKHAVLISNGIDVPAIDAAHIAVKQIPGRLLFVGRLEPMKGVDTLLKAFARLVETSGSGGKAASCELRVTSYELRVTSDIQKRSTYMSSQSSLHLRIVGDGSQRGRLERLAAHLGIADWVTFVGRVEPQDIAQEYAAAQIFCGLSRSEALGNVFLEAQAAGCAVIGTQVGGIPDIVQNGETGLLVQPDQPEEAAQAILRLLQDDALRAAVVQAGKRHARGYGWDAITVRYREVYDDMRA